MSGVHPEPGAGAVCVRAAGTARGVGLRCLDWGARGILTSGKRAQGPTNSGYDWE